MKKNFIITIARQYGCGGRTIGKMLAEKLGIDYIDNELIEEAAKENGVDSAFYSNFDEKASGKFSAFLSYSAHGGYYVPLYNDLLINDKLYYTQANIIKKHAENPCIIVGRCADYILNDKPNIVKIFLHADLETRKDRIVNAYGVTDKNIDKLIAKADKRRATYYNTYTDQEWGTVKLYDITLNTSKLNLNQVVEIIYSYLQELPFGD